MTGLRTRPLTWTIIDRLPALIIARYIIREHIAPFIFGLSLIIFIFTMNLLFQTLGRIAGKGLSLMVIFEYFLLNLAWILTLAIPMAVLIASLSAYGRMSGDGEITALRASGISPGRLVTPMLWVGALMILVVGWFNNYILPDMNHRTKLLLTDISRKKPTLTIESGIYTFTIPGYVLLAREIDPKSGGMRDITIYDEHQPGERSTIVADSGRLKFIREEVTIRMTLFDGEIHRQSPRGEQGYELTRFDSSLFRIAAPEMVLRRENDGYRGDRELSIEDMLARIKEIKARGNKFDERRVAAYLVEVHKKFSIPAACLVMVLLGAPLGMLAQRGGLGVAGGISLLFFTIYWAFLGGGEDLADRGIIHPAVAMWSPNLLLALVGLWFIRLAKRRTSIPAVGWIIDRIQVWLGRGSRISPPLIPPGNGGGDDKEEGQELPSSR